jgi:hypothetical protein
MVLVADQLLAAPDRRRWQEAAAHFGDRILESI